MTLAALATWAAALAPVTACSAVIAAGFVAARHMRRDGTSHPVQAEVAVARSVPSSLERMAAGFGAAESAEVLVAAAAAALVGLEGIAACRFEPFPFDPVLPRLGHSRVELPAEEPGTTPVTRWSPADGVELPVRVSGLPLGRFVLVGPAIAGIARIPRPIHARILSIGDRLDAALSHQWSSCPATGIPEGATWLTSSSSPS